MNTIKKRRVRNAPTFRTQCQLNPLAAKFGIGFYIVADKAARFNGGGYADS